MEEEKQKNEEKVDEESSKSKKESVSKKPESDSKKTLISVLIVVLLIVGALELSGKTNLFRNSTIATVNGEQVSQKEFDARVSQIFSSDQAQLIDLDDPALRKNIEDQILDEIINTRLLIQNAKEAGYEVTEAEVDTEYQLILERLGSALNTEEEKEALLETELEKNLLTKATFRENISDQLLIEQFFSGLIDVSTLTPTEEEIDRYYTQLNESQEGVPPLDDIRTEIETQIVSQKRQQAVGVIIQELRAEADIVIKE